MDYKEALEYISGVEWFGSKPGTERVSALLAKLGDPQKGLKYVHVAGTNGKGSCAVMLASVFKAAHYKTGLYTSPYLYRFNERMQINGKQIDDDVLADIVSRIRPLADAMEDHPTEFELMTAAALLWYSEEKCDVVVLEVGMGGRYDATNVIDDSECAVIMNIGLDHTKILGDTVEKIAWEKAGIIKPAGECVLYQQSEGVTGVVRAECEKQGAKLHIADFSAIESQFDCLEGQVFTYRGIQYALPLLGAHQLRNAAAVLETVEVLRQKGWELAQEDVEHGLYAVAWPARFEVLSDDPYFVVDGGHNPQCAHTVADNLVNYFPGERRVLLLGVLADKDYPTLLDILAPLAEQFVCVQPNSPRALPAAELGEFLKKYGKPVTVCQSIKDGCGAAQDAARSVGGMVCAVGSLYMVGDIRDFFGLH